MAELLNISEEEKIKRRMALTPTQRFRLFMRLYKLGKFMQKAKPKVD